MFVASLPGFLKMLPVDVVGYFIRYDGLDVMFQDIVIKTIFWYDVIIIKIFFFIMHLYLFPERVPLKP